MAQHPKFNIGLNETLLGIVAPTWVRSVDKIFRHLIKELNFQFIDTMVNVIGQRESERALQLGHLYSGEEALKVGLIDELVAPAEMEERVQMQLKQWLKVPPKARAITKTILRQPVAEKLIKNKESDIEGNAH